VQLGLASLRLVVGGLFMGHGLQKLTGWFDGHGLKATGEAFESMQLSPGVAHAAAAGAAETGGGALLAAGLQTPLAAALLSGTMITAIRKVHAPNGPWATKGGYEYNLVLLAVVFALADAGPGRPSLDDARGRRHAGLGWALVQLAAGAAGSIVAVELGSRRAAALGTADGADGAEQSGAQSVNGDAPTGADAVTT
jgi:putative oxidoreductase